MGKKVILAPVVLTYPNRPICWIDDEVGYYTLGERDFWRNRSVKTMLLQTKTHLTKENLEAVIAFISSPSESHLIDLTDKQSW